MKIPDGNIEIFYVVVPWYPILHALR